MSKSTTLDQLNVRWHEQKVATHKRTFSAAGNLNKERWAEVVRVHKRRVLRRKGYRNRAANVAGILAEYQIWAEVIRSNRKHLNMPPEVHRFGNGGQEKLP
jgi:hypothetical protein